MKEMNAERKIIHVDMDAFYASVEQMDNPELRGKALAVGGNENRGVVAAASYEARKFGVRSALSSVLAKKYCPELIFVPPRFDRYKEISQQIRAIFYDYTDLVEPLSLDEAYLDVTHNKKNNPSASLIAKEIRDRIFTEVGLPASAGISCNKFIAKIASDFNKPNGQKTVPPEEVESFVELLPIRKFHGVGKVTTEKMFSLGIFTGSDLKSKSIEFLQQNFGNSAQYYHDVARGIHHSTVKSTRIAKSVAAEHTFDENLSSEVFLSDKLAEIATQLEKRIARYSVAGKTVTLKIKYSDFTTQTRSRTLPYYISDAAMLLETAKSLLYQDVLQNSVRLLGISLTNLNTNEKKAVAVQLKFEF